MGTKNNPGTYDCYDKAEDDEPMFVLLARDPDASFLVRVWAARQAGRSGPDAAAKVNEAHTCANAMDEWRRCREPGVS
jgi:hypothetical protein